MNRKISTVLLGALMTGSVFAADSDVKVGANFDINYLYNTDITTSSNNKIPGLANSNQMNELNVSEVFVSFAGTVKNLDWFVEANLGGEGSVGNNAEYINRAWLTHNVNEMFSISAGRLSTDVGNESYMAKDNWNYTRSYLFQVTDDWGNGVSAKYDFKNGVTANLAFMNAPARNEATAATNSESSASQVLGVAYSNEKLSAKFDYFRSKDVDGKQTVAGEWFTHYDVHATYQINDQFHVGAIYAMGKGDIAAKGNESKYTDWAILGKYKATENFWASLRYEQFKEETDAGGTYFFTGDELGTGTGFGVGNSDNSNDFSSTTLTLAYDFMNGSEFRLEGRMDKSDEKVWTKADGTTDDSTTTVALAWLFRI